MVYATSLQNQDASYVARKYAVDNLDMGQGKILLEAPPNAHLQIISVTGWGQTADIPYVFGIAPPDYIRQQDGKLQLDDPSTGPYALCFASPSLNGATAEQPFTMMNTDRIAPGMLIVPAGWSLYVFPQITSGTSGSFEISACGIYLSTYQTLNFQG